MSGDGKITLSWDAVPGAAGYRYRYRVIDNGSSSANLMAARAALEWVSGVVDSTTVTITGLINGKTYEVSVQTITVGDRESDFSTGIEVSSGITIVLPGANSDAAPDGYVR